MNKNLSYRQGSISDLKQINRLAITSYEQYSNVLTPDDWQKLNGFLNDEKTFTDLIGMAYSFLCVDDSTVVGMAFLIPSGNPTEIFPEDFCYIRMVGVHPAYNGLGIAKRLTSICIDQAKSLNEKTIALHTSEFMNAARHIYENIGFTVLKEITPRMGKRHWLYKLDIS